MYSNDSSTPKLVVRFSGDSGDGVQTAGSLLSSANCAFGNDVRSFSDFPAEIKAPAGTIAGVSGYQLSFGSDEVYTHGEQYDILVAFNPAGLKVSIANLRKSGMIILDKDTFKEKDLIKAGYESDPLSAIKDNYQIASISMTTLTLNAVEQYNLSHSKAKRCKNMFALGLTFWLCDRVIESVAKWIAKKYKDEKIVAANIAALKAGYNYGETLEISANRFSVPKANLSPGTYRQISGNQALSLAALSVAEYSGFKVLAAGYPITPASDILHNLIEYNHKNLEVLQMEDEIAAVGAALGASYGGNLGVTFSSGPGLDLMHETIGLAVSAELPLVIIDVQRSGPSTGMPTKTEQTDLLAAVYGRHGESPLPVIAAKSPKDCYDSFLKACEIAVKQMTPVILLSESILANGVEPWNISNLSKPNFHINDIDYSGVRDANHAPNWAHPGNRSGKVTTYGGLEKDYNTGYISYDPANHQLMTNIRNEKIKNSTKHYSPIDCYGDFDSRVAVISWGSSYASVREALLSYSNDILHVNVKHVYPLPENMKDILKGKHCIVVEHNSGQLATLLRDCLPDIRFSKINAVTGMPFKPSTLKLQIANLADTFMTKELDYVD